MTKIGHAGKDWKKCKMIKSGHSESLWMTLVGKDWKKKSRMTRIGQFESFSDHFGGKDRKKCEMIEIGHSKSF